MRYFKLVNKIERVSYVYANSEPEAVQKFVDNECDIFETSSGIEVEENVRIKEK